MKSIGVIFVCVVAIVVAPVPFGAQVWALAFIGVGLLCAVIDEVLTFSAHLKAGQARQNAGTVAWLDVLGEMTEEDERVWREYLGQDAVAPLPQSLPQVRKVTRFPSQRQPGVGE